MKGNTIPHSSRKVLLRHRMRSRRNARGSTLLGIFIGLVLGLGIAATVAFYLGRSGFASVPAAAGAKTESPKTAKLDPQAPASAAEKPRFDFYKILPGGTEPKVGKPEPATSIPRPDNGRSADAAAKTRDRFWLQAGAFASESEAENLRARLALSGLEAGIQAASFPDKTIRYRVRLGPYDNTDEVGKMKTELGKRGFEVAVIKNQ